MSVVSSQLKCELLSFKYGSKTIEYRISYGDRKTLEIAVLPDSSVVVKAPTSSDSKLVEAKIHKRSRWIIKQLNFFEHFNPKQPSRKYIMGETHLYLGKRYRLKIISGDKNSVKLMRGFFVVTCVDDTSPSMVKKLMEKWYREKAHNLFEERLNYCWQLCKSDGYEKPHLAIRAMKKRWGSLSEKGTVTLNNELIKAPKDCIDYVLIHELCHLKFKNHSGEFYKLLENVLPDWKKMKHKLELSVSVLG
jgi:predicted metal-dependent hydrolase